MRHAEAEPPRERDEMRKLTQLGEKQAFQQGKRIKEEGLEVDFIACSSALRALQTAEKAKRGMRLEDTKIHSSTILYNALSKETKFASFLDNPSSKTLLIVGHMPIILKLTNHLAGENFSSFPPSALVWLEWLDPSWENFAPQSALLKKFFAPPQILFEEA